MSTYIKSTQDGRRVEVIGDCVCLAGCPEADKLVAVIDHPRWRAILEVSPNATHMAGRVALTVDEAEKADQRARLRTLKDLDGAAATLAACAVLKPALDAVAFSRLRDELFSWRAFGAGWVKDALLFLTWVHGLFARTVLWRGNRLRVLPGGGLAPFPQDTSEEVAESFPALHAPAAAAWSNVQA